MRRRLQPRVAACHAVRPVPHVEVGVRRELGQLHEEGVDRDGDGRHAVVGEQRLVHEVGVAQEGDAVGEVGVIGGVVGREDAVEVLADGHEVDVVAEVGAEGPDRGGGRDRGEDEVGEAPPVVGGRLQVGDPPLRGAGAGELLVEEADRAAAVDRQRWVGGPADLAEVGHRPGRAAVLRASHVQGVGGADQVGPGHVEAARVPGVDGDGDVRGHPALLAESLSPVERDRYPGHHPLSHCSVPGRRGRVRERGERGGSRPPVVVPHDHQVAGEVAPAGRRPPPVEDRVDGAVVVHGWPDRWAVLAGRPGRPGLDPGRGEAARWRGGRAGAVEREVDGGGAARRGVEVVVADVDDVEAGAAAPQAGDGLDVGLVDAGALPVDEHRHRRGGGEAGRAQYVHP